MGWAHGLYAVHLVYWSSALTITKCHANTTSYGLLLTIEAVLHGLPDCQSHVRPPNGKVRGRGHKPYMPSPFHCQSYWW
jgi:hypothetical protein